MDEFASLYDHLMELDPGATPGGVLIPHPGPAFGGQAGIAMQARSTQLYTSRQKKLFGLIRRHIEDDAIRDEIDANANGDAVAAWAIVVGHGQPPASALTDGNRDDEWTSASIFFVGIDENTIRNFKALLERLNRERPAAEVKNNAQIFRKLLNSITFPVDIKQMCESQLQDTTWLHVAGPLNGQPSIPMAVNRLSEIWKKRIKEKVITIVPPKDPNATAPRSNRVNAANMMVVNANMSSVSDPLQAKAIAEFSQPVEQFGGPFSFAALQRAFDMEGNCWNCWGSGHRNKDHDGTFVCPSPQLQRPVAQMIKKLEAVNKKQASRNDRQPGGRRFKFVRKPPAPSSAQIAQTGAEEDTIFVDSKCDGYDSIGNYVGSIDDSLLQTETPDPVQPPEAISQGGMVTAVLPMPLSLLQYQSPWQRVTSRNRRIFRHIICLHRIHQWMMNFIPISRVAKFSAICVSQNKSMSHHETAAAYPGLQCLLQLSSPAQCWVPVLFYGTKEREQP